MADQKISALPAATTPLAGTEVLPIVQSSTTVKVAVSDLTAGRAVSATQLTVSTGNVIIGTAGKGIDFSANTSAAGMTSELLTWYEEGTWTPTIAAVSGTYTTVSAQAGTYTRVGRMVHIIAAFRVDNKGTGSVGANVTNLPFAIAANRYSGSGWNSSSGAGYVVLVNNSTTTVTVYRYDGVDPIVAGNVNYIALTYFV